MIRCIECNLICRNIQQHSDDFRHGDLHKLRRVFLTLRHHPLVPAIKELHEFLLHFETYDSNSWVRRVQDAIKAAMSISLYFSGIGGCIETEFNRLFTTFNHAFDNPLRWNSTDWEGMKMVQFRLPDGGWRLGLLLPDETDTAVMCSIVPIEINVDPSTMERATITSKRESGTRNRVVRVIYGKLDMPSYCIRSCVATPTSYREIIDLNIGGGQDGKTTSLYCDVNQKGNFAWYDGTVSGSIDRYHPGLAAASATSSNDGGAVRLAVYFSFRFRDAVRKIQLSSHSVLATIDNPSTLESNNSLSFLTYTTSMLASNRCNPIFTCSYKWSFVSERLLNPDGTPSDIVFKTSTVPRGAVPRCRCSKCVVMIDIDSQSKPSKKRKRNSESETASEASDAVDSSPCSLARMVPLSILSPPSRVSTSNSSIPSEPAASPIRIISPLAANVVRMAEGVSPCSSNIAPVSPPKLLSTASTLNIGAISCETSQIPIVKQVRNGMICKVIDLTLENSDDDDDDDEENETLIVISNRMRRNGIKKKWLIPDE